MNNPSQAQANAVLRVLNNNRLKFTVMVTKPDGSKFEFQSDYTPDIKWDESCRSMWLTGFVQDPAKVGTYEGKQSFPIMVWEPGSIVMVEANPK